MADRSPEADRETLRQWVETWRRAGPELEEIRRRELASIDTQKAIRQIFGTGDWQYDSTPSTTSRLVEQQDWFTRLRLAKRP
jgi:hypothetical protein